METLMMALTIIGILVSALGVWFSWKAMKNAHDAKQAAEAASQAIKARKDIESISEVISYLDKAIITLNKRLSGNTDRGANINTENQLLRDCTALVSRNEGKIKNKDYKSRVQNLRRGIEKAISKYIIDGDELNKAAEEIVSGIKEIQQIFNSENENAIY